ncbi:BLUF domain-containing protein [Fulvivirga sp. RKSG066]|uniref:BLUF domain-containing protein n=1 Tax=Fulvivirga aurantia TaxID=2529383 RepID=UPI0012BC649E|nr:BLUF domain-containing protein [Fulvivirga aurantia]MTI21569.1 BLUF domain-containing protein [Fulvivirga aurantia]
MHYLVYTSIAKGNPSERDLETLLFQSQRNNSRVNITGLLLYVDGKFVQVLEGEKRKVQQLYKVIKKDDRHRDVNLIIDGEKEERDYSGWYMGYRSIMPEEVMSKLGYRDPEAWFRSHKLTKESHVSELFMRLFFDKNFNNLTPEPQ